MNRLTTNKIIEIIGSMLDPKKRTHIDKWNLKHRELNNILMLINGTKTKPPKFKWDNGLRWMRNKQRF